MKTFWGFFQNVSLEHFNRLIGRHSNLNFVLLQPFQMIKGSESLEPSPNYALTSYKCKLRRWEPIWNFELIWYPTSNVSNANLFNRTFCSIGSLEKVPLNRPCYSVNTIQFIAFIEHSRSSRHCHNFKMHNFGFKLINLAKWPRMIWWSWNQAFFKMNFMQSFKHFESLERIESDFLFGPLR